MDVWLPAGTVLSIAALIISIGLGVIGFLQRGAKGAKYLLAFNLIIAVVAAANILGRLAPGVEMKRFWGSWQFAVGAVGGVLFWFAYSYQNPAKPLSKWVKAVLILEPLVTLLLALTDRLHPLMRQNPYLLLLDSPRYVPASYGVWFWFDVLYGCILYLIAGSMLTQTLVRTPIIYRRKVSILLAGLAMPMGGLILLLAGIVQIYQAEIFIAFLTVTNVFLAWGVYTRQLNSILPFARDTLFQDTSQGILLADVRFRILDANAAALKLLEKSREGLAGKAITDVMEIDLQGLEVAASLVDANAPAQKIHVGDRDLLVFFSPVKDQRAVLVGWLVMLHDYTEIHRLEEALAESELKYRNVADNADEGILIIQDQVVRYINRRLAGLGNYNREEVAGHPFIQYIHPDEREKILNQYLRRIGQQDAPELYETVLLRSDGSPIDVEINANRIEYLGKPAVVAFIRDITQRKQTGRELARVQERYRVFVEQSLDGFILLDEQGLILDWNRAMEDLSLLTREEVIGRPYAEVEARLMPERQREEELAFAGVDERAGSDSPQGANPRAPLSEVMLYRKDGTRRLTQQMVSPLMTENGNHIGISVRDVTDLREVELELHDSEQRFRSMADAAPVFIWMSDGDGKCHYFNSAWEKFTGQSIEQLLGFGWTSFCHPDDLLTFWETLKQAGQEGKGYVLEFRMRRKDGKYRWMLGSSVFHGSVSGEPAGFTGSCVDITDQKEREIELRGLTRAIEQSPVGVYITNLKGEIEYVNPRMCEMSGYAAVEILGQGLGFFRSSGDGHAGALERLKTLTNGNEYKEVFCNTRKDHSQYWVRATLSAIYDPAGKVTNYILIEEDITAQRQAEEIVRQQSARMEAIFNNPEIGIGLANRQGEYTSVNQRWADMLGYSREELAAVSVLDLTDPEDAQATRDNMEAMFLGQTDRFQMEKRYKRKDGTTFWGELVAVPILGPDGSIQEGVGFISDITERRMIQERLRESEALYRSIINASPDTIAITDLLGNIRYASPIALQMFGYDSPIDLDNRTLMEFLVPEERKRAVQNLGKLAQGEKMAVDEYRAFRKDGTIFHFEVNGEVLRQEDGQPYGFVFVLRDVSVRKEMEAGQHQRMQELEALRETMNDISSELELSRVLTAIVRRVLALLGAGECEVALVDQDSRKLRIVVSYNRDKDYTGLEMEDGEGIMGRATQTRRTVIIEDYATWEGRSPQFEPVHRTVICVPLLYNQELLGAISVGADPDLKKFDLRDIRMIEMFSQQAAIAIHNARLFSEVQRLAVTDALTGIYNRRAFFDRARQEYNRSVRYGHRISVIMLDVDHFKVINDRFGHAAGDEALRTIANLCTSNLRACDILGRYGGEEFTILVPETPLNGALSIAQRLCDQIAAISISSERGVIRVTASIGVAEMCEETSGLDELIDRADQALYRAKQSGRNRVAI